MVLGEYLVSVEKVTNIPPLGKGHSLSNHSFAGGRSHEVAICPS